MAMKAQDYTAPQQLPPDVHVVTKRKSTGNLQPVETNTAATSDVDQLIKDLESEANTEATPAQEESTTISETQPAQPESTDKIQKLLEKYKTPEALAKALVDMDQERARYQSERDILARSSHSTQTQSPAQINAGGRVEIRPWDKKKVNETFMDDPAEHMESFGQHLMGQVQDLLVPLYDTAAQSKLSMEFPGLVTQDTIPVIRALAREAEGETMMAKLRKAATQYKEQYGYPKTSTAEDATATAAMKEAVKQPEPSRQIRTPRSFTRAQIQYLAAYKPQDYQRLLPAIERAYKEGRVREA